MTLATGQVWSFEGTDDTPQLIVTIGHIDSAADLGADAANSAVISVTLAPSNDAEDEGWPQVDHAPLSAAAFTGAELVMEGVSTTDAFTQGYKAWRAVFDEGKAGVFTLSPPQAYAAIVATYADAIPPE